MTYDMTPKFEYALNSRIRFANKLILLLLVSTDTWQTTKCVRVQRLREGLQNGGHRDPLVR
jgi:hypothetical protein